MCRFCPHLWIACLSQQSLPLWWLLFLLKTRSNGGQVFSWSTGLRRGENLVGGGPSGLLGGGGGNSLPLLWTSTHCHSRLFLPEHTNASNLVIFWLFQSTSLSYFFNSFLFLHNLKSSQLWFKLYDLVSFFACVYFCQVLFSILETWLEYCLVLLVHKCVCFVIVVFALLIN